MDMPVNAADTQPLKDADLCVSCGLCLPHCPTYRVTRDENESPRGRIQLMRALARGQLPRSSKLEAHLDRCLVCRACEAVCPAKVPYGRLIDQARARIARERPLAGLQRALGNLAAHPRRLNAALRLARIGRRLGLRALARRTGLPGLSKLSRLDAALPQLPAARTWKTYYPAVGGARGAVSLFLGCFARLADTETIEAAIFLLNRFGYDVRVPDGQTCCGALHQHAGNAGAAEELVQTNLSAFASGAEPLLYLASGCGATLIEYPEPFPSRVRDFCEFLACAADVRSLHSDRPLGVAVHEPCTQRNVLHNAAPVYALLGGVRGLTAAPLAGNGLCCGGAGSYFLDQPAIADRLGAEKIAAIERAGVRTVLTSNIGCALHLNAGLRARGLDAEVIHPAVLLRRIVEAGSA